MGEHRHKLTYLHPDDPPVCTSCGVGVGVVWRRNRWVCSIAWRQQHGYNKAVGGRIRRRTEHNVTAANSSVTCSCGRMAEQASNDLWVCPSQMEAVEAGIRRQAESPNPGGW